LTAAKWFPPVSFLSHNLYIDYYGERVREVRDIREAETDLREVKRDGDRELQLEINDRLNLLLEEKKQLTTG
jgi:hypothetical protein